MKSAPARVSSSLAAAFRRLGAAIRQHPVLFAALLPVLVVASLIAYVVTLIPLTPNVADIRKFQAEQPSVVLSADGKELAVFKRANREWVKLADISPNVIEALIATEDHRFFEHHGIDVKRTASAAAAHLDGRPRRRLHHHAAAGAQPLSRGDRPGADLDAQDQGSDHGPEDRVGLYQDRRSSRPT